MSFHDQDARKDTMKIKWQLINACNLGCQECLAPDRNGNCVYVRSRIMTMARKLIQRPRPAYDITLAGGEVTLHPFARDVIEYFLTSGRNVRVTLESNGSKPTEWYLGLADQSCRQSFRLALNLHPAYIKPETALAQIVTLAQNGYNLHVRLYPDPQFVEISRLICSASEKLRPLYPFTFEVAGKDKENKKAWQGSDKTSLGIPAMLIDEAESPVVFMPDDEDRSGTEAQGVDTGRNSAIQYCCHGLNNILVFPDGHFKGASCALAPLSSLPLWHDDASLESVTSLFKCGASCKNCSDTNLPKFVSETAAKQHQKEFNRLQDYWAYEIPHLLHEKPSASELVRARFRRLKAIEGAKCVPSLAAYPVWEYWDRITDIYQNLATSAAKESFLRFLKAMGTGNPTFFPPTALASPLEPLIPAWASGLPVRLRLESPVKASDLFKHRETIIGSGPGLEIALPLEPAEFLDQLSWLLDSLQGYSYELRVRNGLPCFIAEHPDQIGAHPLSYRRAGSQARKGVSVVVIASNNADNLDTTLYSVLAQDLEDIEIIVLDNGSEDATPDLVKKIQRKSRGILRFSRVDKRLPYACAFNLAFNQAVGHAVLFLKPGDILLPGILKKSLLAMRENGMNVIGFTIAEAENGVEWQSMLTTPTPGYSAGSVWLSAWANGYGLSGLLVETAFLLNNSIRMRGYGDFGDLFLGLDIFSSNPRIGVVLELGLRHSGESVVSCAGARVADVVRSLHASELAHGTDAVQKALTRIYETLRDSLFAAMNGSAPQKKSAADLLDAATAAPDFVRRLLEDFLAEHGQRYESRSGSLAVYGSSPLFFVQTNHPAEYAAANRIAPKPKLSVIVTRETNENELVGQTRRLLGQTLKQLEIIVVAGVISPDVWEELCDLADFDHRLRLYRIGHAGGHERRLMFGLEKAQSPYIMVSDVPLDMPPDYLGDCMAQSANADLILNLPRNYKAVPGILPQNRACLISSDGAHALCRKPEMYHVGYKAAIYGAELIKSCLAGDRTIDQQSLFANALREAANIILIHEDQLKISGEQLYHLSEIGHELRFYEFLNSSPAAHENEAMELGKHLEKRFFPALRAALADCGSIPLGTEELAAISSNALLMETMLRVIASRTARPLAKHRRAIFSLLDGHRNSVATVSLVPDMLAEAHKRRVLQGTPR